MDMTQNLRIERIVGRVVTTQISEFFYVGISSKENTLKVFDRIALIDPISNNKVIGTVIRDSTLKANQIAISESFKSNLKTRVGSILAIQIIYDCQYVPTVDVIPVRSKNQSSQQFKDQLPDKRVLTKWLSRNLVYSYVSNKYVFKINNVRYKILVRTRSGYGQVGSSTYFNYVSPFESAESSTLSGQEKAFQYLYQILIWPQLYKKQFETMNIQTPKGVLLHGPPGCGKTYILKQVLKNSEYKVFHVSGPELLSKYVGGSESALRKIFTQARKQKSVILFDQIDSIGSKREHGNENQSRLVSQLLTCMDGIVQRGSIVVVATTNHVNRLDPSLRRSGRFDKELAILPPDIDTRERLMKKFLAGVKIDSNLSIQNYAYLTNGYVHADLKLLCNEAKMNVIQRVREVQNTNEKLQVGSVTEQTQSCITAQDLNNAMKKVQPTLLRQYNSSTKKRTQLKDIIGYQKVKERLFRELSYPITHSQTYKSLNLKPIRGVLLTGPPGTGKTTLVKALANELNHNFIFISGSDLLDKYYGQTEQKIKELFQKAQYSKPCIVFIDQIDALLGQSSYSSNFESSKNGLFLSLMDGMTEQSSEIIFIGTTNKPHKLSNAMLRAGRFELILRMDYPNVQELKSLYEHYFYDVIGPNFGSWSSIVDYSLKHKFTGADVSAIKRICVNKYLSHVSGLEVQKYMKDFKVMDHKFIINNIKQFVEKKLSNVQKLEYGH